MARLPKVKRGDEILQTEGMDGLARHLGFVVIVWGMVEESIRELLHSVVMISEPNEHVATVVMSETPFRSQISILRKAAFIKRPESEWFVKLDRTLTSVESTLHDRRNRFIHDPWIPDDDGAIIRVERSKSEVSIGEKGRRALKLREPVNTTIAEIVTFLEQADGCYLDLIERRSEYLIWAFQNAQLPLHIRNDMD